MELYILDSLLRRIDVVDTFESLIWTDRWTSMGDLQLSVKSTLQNRQRFTPDTKVAMNLSDRMMTIETVKDSTDADGKSTLAIGGYSTEKILEDRVAKSTMLNLTTDPRIVANGTPRTIVTSLFDHICRTGGLSLADMIPFLQPGTISPASTIPEVSTVVHFENEPTTLYRVIQLICEQYDLGFRIVRNGDMSQLYFEIYTGHDRTTKQTIKAPVVFAPDFDNLQNTSELTSVEKSKNVAYVFSEFGSATVYPPDVDPDVDGFDRRVLLVKDDTVDANTPPGDIQSLLTLKGLSELSKVRPVSAFDGELNQNSLYIYGRDYGLGDLVEMRNRDGVVTFRRVTEQIFACDGEGERSYPTLSSNLFINPGSWLSWNNATVWQDFTTEFWSDME